MCFALVALTFALLGEAAANLQVPGVDPEESATCSDDGAHAPMVPSPDVVSFVQGSAALSQRHEVRQQSLLLSNKQQELSNFLQAKLERQHAAKSVRFLLGRGSRQGLHEQSDSNKEHRVGAGFTEQQMETITHQQMEQSNLAQQPTTTTAPPLNLDYEKNPKEFFEKSLSILNAAGLSTPLPQAALINAPPPTATPRPWERMGQSQPLDTKLGGAILAHLSGGVTQSPPPSQASTDTQFVAQCPMVLFNKELSVRAPSCENNHGRWVEGTRDVMGWSTLPASGVRFGVDSAISGPAAALFADITQEMTLDSYSFVLKNCIGVERWHIEELVYKIDNMGHVSSTMELHDVNMNSVAYFFRYLIKKPNGTLVAESTMYRMGTRQVNFTEVKDGIILKENLLAVVDKQGTWQKKGWKECMAPISPRGWKIQFTDYALTMSEDPIATVQDVRVAIAAAITLMGHRDEGRGSDGINREGSSQQMMSFTGGLTLILLICLLCCNFCQVFRGSGIKDKFKKTFFDIQGLLPRRPHAERNPPMHASY